MLTARIATLFAKLAAFSGRGLKGEGGGEVVSTDRFVP
jgi:hypothetical protein